MPSDFRKVFDEDFTVLNNFFDTSPIENHQLQGEAWVTLAELVAAGSLTVKLTRDTDYFDTVRVNIPTSAKGGEQVSRTKPEALLRLTPAPSSAHT